MSPAENLRTSHNVAEIEAAILERVEKTALDAVREAAFEARIRAAAEAIAAGTPPCEQHIPECGGFCRLQEGHEPPCACGGDDGGGCPA